MLGRLKGLTESWRGIDPLWYEYGGMRQGNLMVLAPFAEVVASLRETSDASVQFHDLLGDDGETIGLECEEPVFLYQLRGHIWTQIEAPCGLPGIDHAQDLSRRLSTTTFEGYWHDGGGYRLFDRGREMEALDILHENPTYQGEQGQADLIRKRAEGWQISLDHSVQFFSKRGAKLDVESIGASCARVGQVAAEWNMFVACVPFWVDPTTRRVEFLEGWNRHHFNSANVVTQVKT